MKLLKSSNYNNKEVINFIKSSFSIMESLKCAFQTSQFLEIEHVKVYKKNDIYIVELTNIQNVTLCSNHSKTEKTKSRTKAIKFILLNIGIISKKDFNN